MKTFITLSTILAAGTLAANAEYSVSLDSSFYSEPNAWVYVWNDSNEGEWSEGAKWWLLKALDNTSLTTNLSYKPSDSDPAFIGYEFSYAEGVQTLTANDTAITFTSPTWVGAEKTRIYLGKNVVFTGTSNGFNGSQNVNFNFGDFSGTSKIEMAKFWMQTNASVNFSGSIAMTEDIFSYTVFESSNMQQCAGTWSGAGISVVDKSGNALTYTEDDELKGTAGYYYLETSDYVQGSAYSVLVKAVGAVPEPSMFGLLAGVGALALAGTRRRRR